MPVQLLGGDPTSIGDPAVFGVITVSDRASSGVYEDLSGPAILQFFGEAIASPWSAKYAVIPDERPLIEDTIKHMVSMYFSSQFICTHSLLFVSRQTPEPPTAALPATVAQSHATGRLCMCA